MVLLYLGRIHPKKGLDLWLQAWQARIAISPNLDREPVVLVGGAYSDPAFRSRVLALAEPFERAGRLHFLGELSGLPKEEAFTAASAFFLPSQSEGLPNAVLEAMARGLPAFITPGCNMPEIGVYNAGRLFDFSLMGMMEAQDWMAAHPGDLMEMGRNAERLVAERFSLEQSMRKYEEIVRDAGKFPAI
jgi:glycosyltransferase involved in cell wall biosynthesis